MKPYPGWVVDGNIFENTDKSGAQAGPLNVFNVRQASGGGYGTNYDAVITDVTYSHNVARNSCEGLEIATRAATDPGNGGGVALPLQRFWLHDNLLYNISTSNPGCSGVNKCATTVGSAANVFTGTATNFYCYFWSLGTRTEGLQRRRLRFDTRLHRRYKLQYSYLSYVRSYKSAFWRPSDLPHHPERAGGHFSEHRYTRQFGQHLHVEQHSGLDQSAALYA